MRKTLTIGAALAAGLGILASCQDKDHYGGKFQGFPTVEIEALTARPAEHMKQDVRIEGVVARQCPTTGCWFFLRDSQGKEVKVEMGDTTPKLPPRKGRTAAVEGRLIRYGDGYEFVGLAVEFR